MKFINCRLCKKQILEQDKICPHCGASKPNMSNIWNFVIISFFAVVIYAAFISIDAQKTENIENEKIDNATPK